MDVSRQEPARGHRPPLFWMVRNLSTLRKIFKWKNKPTGAIMPCARVTISSLACVPVSSSGFLSDGQTAFARQ